MSLIYQHQDVAPSGAAATVKHIRRAPERLIRRALAAAREQRLGLSAISSLLERDDDEQLWNEIMADHSQVAASTSIVQRGTCCRLSAGRPASTPARFPEVVPLLAEGSAHPRGGTHRKWSPARSGRQRPPGVPFDLG
jgi:hypothetical protein